MYEPVFQTTSGNIFKYRYRITVVFMVDLSNYELVVTGTKQQTGFWFQLTQKSHEFPQNHHEYAILTSTYFNLSCFSEVLFQMITEKKSGDVALLQRTARSRLSIHVRVQVVQVLPLPKMGMPQIITGWWFGTFFIFHNVWDNPSY